MWTKQTFVATNPGRLQLSDEKLALLHPELYFRKAPIRNLLLRAWAAAVRLGYIPVHPPYPGEVIKNIRQLLRDGDCNPAIVVSTSPLCVAAYTVDIDTVVLLRFPETLVLDYRLALGTRLISVNSYRIRTPARDSVPGPNSSGCFSNVIPLIGDFLSDDAARLQSLKKSIADDDWLHAAELGIRRLHERPDYYRSGLPRYAEMPPDSMLEGFVVGAIAIASMIAIIGYLLFR
jgi:hypothetical protein